MLQGEHSAKLLTFSKLPFVIKNFVLSIFEWLFYTDFTVRFTPCKKVIQSCHLILRAMFTYVCSKLCVRYSFVSCMFLLQNIMVFHFALLL